MMENAQVAGQDDDVIATAARWVSRIESSSFSAHDRAILDDWLAESPLHRREFTLLLQLYGSAEIGNALSRWQSPTIGRGSASRITRISLAAAVHGKGNWARLGASLAICGSLVLLVISGVERQPSKASIASMEAVAPQAKYATSPGKPSRVTLADGSQLHMNGDTVIRVRFEPGTRDIWLDRGEAFFDVAHDPDQPFVVHTADARFTAVGTAFNISLKSEAAQLTVYDGKVAFSISGPRRLSGRAPAGTNILLPSAGPGTVSQFSPQATADWRSGWIETDDMVLGDLLEALYRRSGVLIEASDEARRMRVSGRFRIDNPNRLMRGLREMHTLVIRHDENRIILEKMSI